MDLLKICCSSVSCISLLYAAAQVEVLSAALRASSLDPQEETMASISKETDSHSELTINDQQNFKPMLGDIVPLIGDTVEVRSEFCTLFLPRPLPPLRISSALVIGLYFVFVW